MKTVIAKHVMEHTDLDEKALLMVRDDYDYSIDSIRSGRLLHSLNLSTHPLVCYKSQLSHKLNNLYLQHPQFCKGDDDSNDDRDDDGSDVMSVIHDCELGLNMIESSITSQKEAKDARIIGDIGAAIQLLSNDVLEYFDDDEEEDDEDEKHIKSLVPTYLKVTLLIERLFRNMFPRLY